MLPNQFTRHDSLFTDAGLAAVFEAFDDLHTAASEGQIHEITALDKQELLGWLQDLVYTAQETIVELEKRSARRARQEAVLHLLK
jgi:hypothetical protein